MGGDDFDDGTETRVEGKERDIILALVTNLGGGSWGCAD